MMKILTKRAQKRNIFVDDRTKVVNMAFNIVPECAQA